MDNKRSIFYQILKTVLQTALAVAILLLLIGKHRGQFEQCLEKFNYTTLFPALICHLFHMVVGSWRWRKLAMLQGYQLTFFEAISLSMQGYFFSLIIPGGAIGGDVAKMGLLARRRQPGNRAEGIFTIFMDRIVGMIALFVLCLILLGLNAGKLHTFAIFGMSETQTVWAAWLLGLLCVAGIFCGIAIFFHRQLQKIPGVKPLFDWVDRHLKNAASRVTAMADLYANSPKELITLTIASIVGVHIMTVLPMFFMLHGAGVELDAAKILLVLTAATIGNIAGLIPLTPGGIGLRDLVVISLLTSGGIASGTADAAQLMTTGISVFSNLSGGLFLLFESSTLHHQSGNSDK